MNVRSSSSIERSTRRRCVIGVVVALVASITAFAAGPAAAAPDRCMGRTVTIVAVPGVETVGTAGDDVIMGTSGNDVIRGLGGRDRICGLGGADRILGGGGADRIRLGGGNDIGIGGKGRDRILGGSGNDTLRGGGGNDVLRGGPGDDIIIGQAGDDVMDGTNGGDICTAGRGDDQTARCAVDRADVSGQVAALESRMVDQINDLRRRVGVPTLRPSAPMANSARNWSARLPTSFAHNPNVASEIPSGWRLWAENIGYRIDPSAGHTATMDAVQRALVNSPGHYANLTNPDLTHVGVGIHIQGNGVYVTQVFARY